MDIGCTNADLATCLGQGFALFGGEQLRQRLLIVQKRLAQFVEQAHAGVQVGLRKALKGLMRRINRALGFRRAAVWHGAQFLTRGRVGDVDHLTAIGTDPRTADKIALAQVSGKIAHFAPLNLDGATFARRLFRGLAHQNRPQPILQTHLWLAITGFDQIMEFLMLEEGRAMMVARL